MIEENTTQQVTVSLAVMQVTGKESPKGAASLLTLIQ
jgi:hypothetical protein